MDPACREVRESMSDLPIDRERILLHQRRCPSCRAFVEAERQLRSGLSFAADVRLDDLSRARIQARLAADFDRMAAENASQATKARWPWLAVAAAALLFLILLPSRVDRPALPPPQLRPYLVAGSVASLDRAARLEVGEGEIVSAEVEGQGTVTLIGPGRALLASRGLIQLDRGLLVARIEHRRDRPFEIRHQDVTVRVVGTRFSVDAREPGRPVVAVVEGVVEVRRAETVARLRPGEVWPTGDLDAALFAERLRPADGAVGSVVVDGTPAGRVSIDGVVAGPTPLIARLAAGPHRIEVRADAHETRALEVNVPVGDVVRRTYALDPIRAEAPVRERKPGSAGRTPPRKRTPPPVTAEVIYRRAEAALAEDRPAEAERHLEELLERFGEDPLAETAAYELARLARSAGRREDAHRRLVELLEGPQDPAVAEAGQRLLCQIDVETGRHDDANSCWRSFRRRFPDSPHDAEALANLIALAHLWHDCPRVIGLFEELSRRHPNTPLLPSVEARVKTCR